MQFILFCKKKKISIKNVFAFNSLLFPKYFMSDLMLWKILKGDLEFKKFLKWALGKNFQF